MVAQACTLHPRNLRFLYSELPPIGLLVSAQSGQRLARKLRIRFRDPPYQFEKQRKRAWRTLVCAFMLQRTMLR